MGGLLCTECDASVHQTPACWASLPATAAPPQVWNVRGEQVGVVRAHTSFLAHQRVGPVKHLAFAPYELRLASGEWVWALGLACPLDGEPFDPGGRVPHLGRVVQRVEGHAAARGCSRGCRRLCCRAAPAVLGWDGRRFRPTRLGHPAVGAAVQTRSGWMQPHLIESASVHLDLDASPVAPCCPLCPTGGDDSVVAVYGLDVVGSTAPSPQQRPPLPSPTGLQPQGSILL